MDPARLVAAWDSATRALRAAASAANKRSSWRLADASARRRRPGHGPDGDGLPVEQLSELDDDQVRAWICAHYPEAQYPGVLIGASNGAAAYLSAAGRLPWLPQTYEVPVACPRRVLSDPAAALEFAERHGPDLIGSDDELVIDLTYDPTPGRSLGRNRTAAFRLKHVGLPRAYADWMATHLAPGAPVIVLADGSAWPSTTIGDRVLFQLGAQRGLGPVECLDQAGTAGLPQPDRLAPEAEWGFDQRALDALAAWCAERGHPFTVVHYDHPEELSPLVSDAFRAWRQEVGQPVHRLLLDRTPGGQALAAVHEVVAPYWSFAPVVGSLAGLHDYLRRPVDGELPELREVLISEPADPTGEPDRSDAAWFSVAHGAGLGTRAASASARARSRLSTPPHSQLPEVSPERILAALGQP